MIDFCLSDKIASDLWASGYDDMLHVEDVKEFIKQLKERFEHFGRLECSSSAYINEIDKLAGVSLK